MTSYRQMRRHARHARRAGLQPMVFISLGDRLPDLAAVIIAHWIWRHRSGLAPLGVALALAGSGLYAHDALRGWWPVILTASAIIAWVLAAFGARFGIAAWLERLYLAVVVLACGTWDALAMAVGGLILSVPWWASRRRRAKVRVERTIAAWPDIAQATGLAGSQIMSATVDLWGWRARLRLARGQTITDVIAKVPAIESGLGTHRNTIRVSPTPDDLANRCELRILGRDRGHVRAAAASRRSKLRRDRAGRTPGYPGRARSSRRPNRPAHAIPGGKIAACPGLAQREPGCGKARSGAS